MKRNRLGTALALLLTPLVLWGCEKSSPNPTAGTAGSSAEKNPKFAESDGADVASEKTSHAAQTVDDVAVVQALSDAGAETEADESGRIIAVNFPRTAGDELVARLPGLPELRQLTLSWTKITGDAVQQFAKLPNLEVLDLTMTTVGDEQIDALAALPNLKSLNVENTEISAAGLQRLREALPNVAINSQIVATKKKSNKDNDRDREPATLAGKIDRLARDYQNAENDIRRQLRRAATEDEQLEIIKNFEGATPTAKEMLKLAQENPDDPATFDALQWIMSAQRGADLFPVKDQAAEMLRTVAEKAPVKDIQAKAKYMLARVLKDKFELANQIQAMSDEERADIVTRGGQALVEHFQTFDGNAAKKETEQLLEQLVALAANERGLADLAEAAKRDLFELQHLSIGAEAPQIEGPDIDGNTLKLSDYRGRVVMLDFWGHW